VTKGHPLWLKSQIFPYDDITTGDIETMLDDLEDLGVIKRFEYHKERFYLIVKFTEHQKVHNPSKARNPEYNGPLPRQSGDTPETFGRTSESVGISPLETETEFKQKQKLHSVELPSQLDLVREIIADLNLVTGKNFRPDSKQNQILIRARLAEGFGLEHFKRVHRIKANQWAGQDKWDRFLRPETLYRPKHFES
jgi:uncharacterized phage protein (TIGR02220 family)